AYQTSAATQTIFVRIFTLAQDECYAIDNFVLHFPYVRAGMVPPLSVCDNEGVGEQQINLPFLFNDQVLDGLNDYQFNITYHSSQADANSGANPLQDDYTLMAPGVTIYARIEPVDFEYCFDTTSIEIILEAPMVNRNPLPLISCDSNNDGYTSFNLHDADADISMGDPDLIITYHPTLLDAQNNLNELPTPYRNDDPWNDVVFVRIKSADSDCYAT